MTDYIYLLRFIFLSVHKDITIELKLLNIVLTLIGKHDQL